MWLTVEVLAVFYVVTFIWFWYLCRSAIRHGSTGRIAEHTTAKLIPFERGTQLRIRRTTSRSLSRI